MTARSLEVVEVTRQGVVIDIMGLQASRLFQAASRLPVVSCSKLHLKELLLWCHGCLNDTGIPVALNLVGVQSSNQNVFLDSVNVAIAIKLELCIYTCTPG